ncbi:AI-2E family transporter [Aliiglaciecola sp. CAU 1673]|uniref:AI-2E family transporter n=1 Tax=Aliiglaciecola sp. CAU 1673 TaxID=3032595 RepID=UPI0023DAA20F|nr:AI-2E family transporter [Aliiglaciecola sp. CAU 1673]MDF2177447.1 AI-2E family transporter [Aliiglaciecola sp. CAU 1673]
MQQEKLEQRFFLLSLGLVTLLFAYLLQSFFGVIFWSCVIGILFYPLFAKLESAFGGRANLAALTTLLLCCVMVIVPALVILASFFAEGARLYEKLESGELDPGQYIEQFKLSFPIMQDFFARFGIDLDNLKSNVAQGAISASQMLAENAVQLGQGTMTLLLHLGVLLYISFFILRDGPQLIAILVSALPLGDEREHLLFRKFYEVTRATIKGNLVVAVMQGAMGGLIFWLLGLQSPLLWAVVMTLLSLVPVVGAALIWAPVALYLLVSGNWIDGLILIAFGAGVIGLVDNILRPVLVGRDTALPDYLVLLSTLGGFAVFGMNGFVVGPLIAALFLTFWDIFIREFNPRFDPGEIDAKKELQQWQEQDREPESDKSKTATGDPLK